VHAFQVYLKRDFIYDIGPIWSSAGYEKHCILTGSGVRILVPAKASVDTGRKYVRCFLRSPRGICHSSETIE